MSDKERGRGGERREEGREGRRGEEGRGTYLEWRQFMMTKLSTSSGCF